MSETAKQQYQEFLKNGVENTPFYSVPYIQLVEYKGEAKAREILEHYQRIHANTPCVKNGVLFLSYAKYLKDQK